MRIAINTRFLLSRKMEGFGWYTYEIVKRLVNNHPEHEFIFFFDRAYDEKFIFADNVTPVVLSPQARHPVLFRIWFNRSVTKALKKHKADLFFSPDGFLSLKTDVPQVCTIHDINFEHHPEDLPKGARNYLRTYFPQFAQKAAHIMTVSDYSKQDIVTTYAISPDKITTAWNGASDAFQPLNEFEKKATEEQFANGRPYILFVGALHPRKNLRRLLPAFEKLHERGISTYDLVIAGEALWKNIPPDIQPSESIRKHVHFTGHLSLEDLTKVMGSASLLAFVPYFEGFGIPLVEAMRCGTPIVCGDRTSLPEVVGDAAILCDPFSVDDISAKLEQVLSHPELQASLKKKGLERSTLFSWNKAAETIWKVFESTIQKKANP